MAMRGRTDEAGRIERRDELLQVLYWLAGEGFVAEMTLEGISRFMAQPADELWPALRDAMDAGLVEESADGGSNRVQLTEAGRHEGKRRFAEEFSQYLARDTHGGECSDPHCDCHHSHEGPAACHSHQGDHP